MPSRLGIKLSEERKLQISKFHKGRKRPESTREKMRGHCGSRGYRFSETQKKQMSLKRRGEKHWNWKGGISKNVHSVTNPEYKQWRSNVFQRDNWTCQTCGVRGIYLEAHHVFSWAKFPELRFCLENGVTLCRECHKLTDNYKGKKTTWLN